MNNVHNNIAKIEPDIESTRPQTVQQLEPDKTAIEHHK